jgi:hypothetical protein
VPQHRYVKAVLTPGLTPFQKLRLSDALRRIAGLPLGSIAQVYLDVDVAAARGLNPLTDNAASCSVLAASFAAEHKIPLDIAACAYGIAVGVRLGRTFAPPAPRLKKWISEEYKQLTEPNRRDVRRYIRRILKIQIQGRAPSAIHVTGDRRPRWDR